MDQKFYNSEMWQLVVIVLLTVQLLVRRKSLCVGMYLTFTTHSLSFPLLAAVLSPLCMCTVNKN